jgi:hypothetical protein
VKFDAVSPRPLIGVVDGTIFAWPADGVLEPGITHHDDLIMAPIIRKGWVARHRYSQSSGNFMAGVIFDSEEDVKAGEPNAISYHEISWEE